jgi:hypothetical protein
MYLLNRVVVRITRVKTPSTCRTMPNTTENPPWRTTVVIGTPGWDAEGGMAVVPRRLERALQNWSPGRGEAVPSTWRSQYTDTGMAERRMC